MKRNKFWMVMKGSGPLPFERTYLSRSEAIKALLEYLRRSPSERFYLLEAVRCYEIPKPGPVEVTLEVAPEVTTSQAK